MREQAKAFNYTMNMSSDNANSRRVKDNAIFSNTNNNLSEF